MQAAAVVETGLTITNPLVLYRTLLATKKIEPDPAQHRLAIHLQKLYHRLKDYEPSIEYRHRLEQVAQTVGPSSLTPISTPVADHGESQATQGLFASFRAQKIQADSLALTRTLTSYEAALQMDSPQGLLLYGEVGTGKSFLVDLLAESLPSQKKRRYHFNTFMLDTFARLEQQRIRRRTQSNPSSPLGLENEHTLLSLARDLVTASPILFLDEFQLPDRASSKILSNLFTSFFQLGGVLIATSNRMPEELSKASGAEFAAPPISSSRLGLSGLRKIFGNATEDVGKGMFARQSDFTQFLEVLKARCETWNMESKTDFRRRDSTSSVLNDQPVVVAEEVQTGLHNAAIDTAASALLVETSGSDKPMETDSSLPAFYVVKSSTLLSAETLQLERIWQASVLKAVCPSETSLSKVPWTQEIVNVYGRKVKVPKAYENTSMWTFEELCGTYLGPADYITLASTYHTIILDEVPVLNFLQKNEARRFITLLDALYEARCRLLIRAEAGPDALFFPDARGLNRPKTNEANPDETFRDNRDDGVYAETLSEIFQDQTVPFRPNISSYAGEAPEEHYTNSASDRSSGAHPMIRSILADEDADFGPVYGAGRSAGASSFDPAEEDRRRLDALQSGPNFQRASAFTGEDEKFAYKRAESRLWELCGRRWWENASNKSWWKPLSKESRTWEEDDAPETTADFVKPTASDPISALESEAERDKLFRHGASPFRTHQDPPPKIPWTHTWGMVDSWGQKAGLWGKGVKGVPERQEEKRREKEMIDRIKPKPRP